MGQFLGALIKVLLASLITGTVLFFLGFDTKTLLGFFELTPQSAWGYVVSFAIWAAPRIILGAMIVIPAWLIIYIFIPPRQE